MNKLCVTSFSLFFALTTTATAQSFCGPVIKANFNGLNGQYPSGRLTIDGQGNLYGATAQGGPTYNPAGSPPVQGAGTIWKYSPTGGLSTLYSPSGSSAGFNGVVLDSQGNLWGSTSTGGSGYGTLFELTAAGVFNTVFEFNGADGQNPGFVVFDSKGNLWGVAGGGATGDGVLFKYSPATQQLTNPLSFPGGIYSAPSGPVTFDSQGNIYGVTASGGSDGLGSLWEYSAQGALSTLFNFSGLNGSSPNGGVTLDGNGNVYGATTEGGAGDVEPASGYGSVWKYSLATGELTTLYSFTSSGTTGQFPESGVTLDANRNVYGTTIYGGTFGDGVVWEYSTAGVLSDLVTFNGANGANPEALVFDSKGNLWGTTNQGGANGFGTLFELTPNTGEGCGATVSSLTFNPTTIANGGSSTGTVTLSEAAPAGGSVVGLSSDNGSVFPHVPGSITIPAGDTTATFQAAADNLFVLSNTVVTFTATLGNSTAQGSVTVTPGINVTSISFKPSSVAGGSSSTATVTIASPAPSSGNEVELSQCQNCRVCPLPLVYPNNDPIVTVPAGSTSVSFTLGTSSTTTSCTAQVYAQSGTATVSTNFTVKPGGSPAPTVSSVSLNPTSVTGGSSSQGTVTLSSAAPSGGSVVSLSSSSSSASVSSSVTVAAGNTTASFTINTGSVTTTTSVVVTATLASSSAQALLTITPSSGGSATLSSLTLNPTSVSGGSSSTGTVTLSAAAPSGGVVVSLTSSTTSVATVPSAVTVSAGQTSASFTVNTQSVSSSTSVTISGTYAGATKSATLTVTSGKHH
jgi:uncharacterized repeat protein (TIGR03803 family)